MYYIKEISLSPKWWESSLVFLNEGIKTGQTSTMYSQFYLPTQVSVLKIRVKKTDHLALNDSWALIIIIQQNLIELCHHA